MSNKVVKLAQPGFDVKTTGDENLIFNSNWPLLKIYKQGSFTTSNNTDPTSHIVTHDLGYAPAFWVFNNLNITGWESAIYTVDDSRSEFTMNLAGFAVSATDKELVFDINPGFFNGTNKFYYYLFALDISKPYIAPITKVGGLKSGPGGKVFKLAKPGKDISSDSLEDYAIHSDCRSPLIHSVFQTTLTKDGSLSGAGYGATYYHNLGYIPIFFVYFKTGSGFDTNNPTPNAWRLVVVEGTTSLFKVDEQKIAMTGWAVAVIMSILILKDPFNVTYNVGVKV